MSLKMNDTEVRKVERYLRKTFGNENIALRGRNKAEDSVEVLLEGEFLGILYKDDEDGETSYNFTMAILDMDLE